MIRQSIEDHLETLDVSKHTLVHSFLFVEQKRTQLRHGRRDDTHALFQLSGDVHSVGVDDDAQDETNECADREHGEGCVCCDHTSMMNSRTLNSLVDEPFDKVTSAADELADCVDNVKREYLANDITLYHVRQYLKCKEELEFLKREFETGKKRKRFMDSVETTFVPIICVMKSTILELLGKSKEDDVDVAIQEWLADLHNRADEIVLAVEDVKRKFELLS